MNKLAIYKAPNLFYSLDGLVKIFKPAEKRVSHVKSALIFNICKGNVYFFSSDVCIIKFKNIIDLNALEGRPQRQILLEPGGDQNVVLRKINDLSDDVLAVGARYQVKDIKCNAVNQLGDHTSGVLGKYFNISFVMKKINKCFFDI